MEAHGFEFLAEGDDGGSGEFVGGLLGDAEGGSYFTVSLAVADAFGDLAEARREDEHRPFEAFSGFKSCGLIGQRLVTGRDFLHTGFRCGGLKRGWDVEIVNVVAVMPHLPFLEIVQGVAHGSGGVSDEVALGRIEKAGRMGERLPGCELDFGMR